MIGYSVIMFAIAVLFVGFAVAVYRGNTNLIHDYHQTKVKDKEAYGKAFGKALFVMALAPLISGMIGLFGKSGQLAITAVFVLFAGLILGFSCILAVQKKYNNGLF